MRIDRGHPHVHLRQTSTTLADELHRVNHVVSQPLTLNRFHPSRKSTRVVLDARLVQLTRQLTDRKNPTRRHGGTTPVLHRERTRLVIPHKKVLALRPPCPINTNQNVGRLHPISIRAQRVTIHPDRHQLHVIALIRKTWRIHRPRQHQPIRSPTTPTPITRLIRAGARTPRDVHPPTVHHHRTGATTMTRPAPAPTRTDNLPAHPVTSCCQSPQNLCGHLHGGAHLLIPRVPGRVGKARAVQPDRPRPAGA